MKIIALVYSVISCYLIKTRFLATLFFSKVISMFCLKLKEFNTCLSAFGLNPKNTICLQLLICFLDGKGGFAPTLELMTLWKTTDRNVFYILKAIEETKAIIIGKKNDSFKDKNHGYRFISFNQNIEKIFDENF